MFSQRTDHDSTANDLTVATRARRERGARVIDLSVSNPTICDLPAIPQDLFAQPAARTYHAEPFGLPAARAAIADEYARAGIEVDPARVVITASTSEAYAFAFKMLADPGQRIAIPAPSYPLFDFLARGEGVETVSYPLVFDGHRYHYEPALIPEGVRAAIAVSPNHPTGSQIDEAFVHALAERGLPLIVDEVFGRFSVEDTAPLSCVHYTPTSGLLLRLCGLSKQLALPQAKLSWILVDGEPALVQEALRRLELIADTFLSVAGPVQHALTSLFARGAEVRAAITARAQDNLRALREQLRDAPCSALRVPAGWVAVVRVPACDDEALATQLLERTGVLTYPGRYFGIPHAALVISLLATEPELAVGAAALAAFLTDKDTQFGS